MQRAEVLDVAPASERGPVGGEIAEYNRPFVLVALNELTMREARAAFHMPLLQQRRRRRRWRLQRCSRCSRTCLAAPEARPLLPLRCVVAAFWLVDAAGEALVAHPVHPVQRRLLLAD